jgi:hypothetical protein
VLGYLSGSIYDVLNVWFEPLMNGAVFPFVFSFPLELSSEWFMVKEFWWYMPCYLMFDLFLDILCYFVRRFLLLFHSI